MKSSSCFLFDVEVQRDFFEPSGSMYTPAAIPVLRRIYRLFAWARANRVPVVSTLLRVPARRLGPFGQKPHCVEGTDGESKLPKTVLSRSIDFGLRNITDLPDDLFQRYQQVIFEKRATDIFAHTRAERLFTELDGGTFILCGAGLSRGIVEAAVGLRRRGFGVILASDAVVELPGEAVSMAYLRMEAKGVVFAPTEKIVVPLPRRHASAFFRVAVPLKS
jgi:nicotinamidase-related amidase